MSQCFLFPGLANWHTGTIGATCSQKSSGRREFLESESPRPDSAKLDAFQVHCLKNVGVPDLVEVRPIFQKAWPVSVIVVEADDSKSLVTRGMSDGVVETRGAAQLHVELVSHVPCPVGLAPFPILGQTRGCHLDP